MGTGFTCEAPARATDGFHRRREASETRLRAAPGADIALRSTTAPPPTLQGPTGEKKRALPPRPDGRRGGAVRGDRGGGRWPRGSSKRRRAEQPALSWPSGTAGGGGRAAGAVVAEREEGDGAGATTAERE